jgi:hypothetical protein
MYAVMRMLGVNIHPATMQTDDGKKMWDKWRKQGDAKYIKSMNAKMSEGDSGAKYKVRSIGKDKKGEYYVSPSTGEKVYKKAKVGDHEVPASKEIKPKVEAMLPASAFASSDQNKLGAAGQLKGSMKRPAHAGDLVGETDKIKGADGKACWDGYRYNGTENGSDKCVKIGEAWESEMSNAISKLFENR